MANATTTSEDILFQGVPINEFSLAYDLSAAQSDGVSAVVLRATAGSDYTDASLTAMAQSVRDSGLRLGFYHYLTAEDEDTARAQARFFAGTISGYDASLRPSMRFDTLNGLSFDAANRIAQTFLSEVEAATGVTPAVYTDAESACLLWSKAIADKYPLWVIDTSDGDAPKLDCSPWKSWTGWQYSNLGAPNCGLPLSRFTANMLSRQIVVPEPPDGPSETEPALKLICVTVALGDTLTAIARLFNTTVNEIVRLNRIANPNRIYPGQRLYVRVADTVPYPCCDTYTVRKGDTLSGIGARFGVSWRQLATINEIPDPNRIYIGQQIKLGLCPGE